MNNYNKFFVYISILLISIIIFPTSTAWATDEFNIGDYGGDESTLRQGTTLELSYGYELTVNAIDAEEPKVWFELTRYGMFVDDAVISSGTMEFDVESQEESVFFDVNKIFHGRVEPLVTISYIGIEINGEREESSISLVEEQYGDEEPEPELPLSAETGSISISSTPSGAKVYLFGTYKGSTPLTLNDIEVGTYSLMLKKSGYDDIYESVDIYADETTTISKSLSAETGSIRVSSSPSGAKVYLDGKYKGSTPLTLNDIEVGTYRLMLKKSGYDNIYESVDIYADETTTISKSLSAQTGSISVSSSPSGAKVYLDDDYIGETPLNSEEIYAGKYEIKLTKNDYEDLVAEISVVAHEESTFSRKMIHEEGSLTISSNPSNAKIYVNGIYKGITPVSVSNLETGLHRIKIEKTGYNTISFTKNIYPRNNEVSRDLELDTFLAIGPFAIILILLFGIIVVRKKRRSKSEYHIQSSNYKDTSVKTKTDPYDVKIKSSVKNDKTEFDNSKPNSSSIKSHLKSDNSEFKIVDNKSENTVSSKPITKNEIPGGNFSGNNKIETMDEKNTDFSIKSAFNYKGATIQYKVKVENPTSEPIADIKVNLYVPDVFILSESTKSIPILKPSESNTVTFDIRPTGECGDCEVSGKVVYYDYKTKKTTEAAIPAKNVSIVCPMIKSKTINESEWRDTLTGLTKAEETTREIDIPASTLFDMASDVLQDMNLFMLDPKVNDSDKLYRAVAKFYGEGVKDLKYAAQIEVVGGSKKSKIILKAWAEKVEALTGFYHGILDELEKRTQIKGSINESIIQNYYHYGDKVDTKINDSLIQRSFNKDVHGSVSDDKDEYQTAASSEDYKINSKSYDEFNYSEVYIYLVDVAHKACGNRSTILNNIDNLSHRKSLYEKGIIVTYGDVLKKFGKNPNNRAHLIELIKLLDKVNGNNKPILLSSLVVNGNKYLPSEQFFKKWTNNSWESELEKIWDSYCDENGVY